MTNTIIFIVADRLFVSVFFFFCSYRYIFIVSYIVTVNLRWKALPIPSVKDEQYAAAPYQRYGHSAVAYGTKVFIWGGRNDEAACNKLFCFDTGIKNNTTFLFWCIKKVI